MDVGFNNEEYLESENYLEKHYPYLEKITALGFAPADKFKKRYPKVKVITYKGGKFPFQDKKFETCWSNAVLEHVGDEQAQILFLKEIKRVAKKSFLTTPNKYFPVEVHTRTPFLHFLLPKKIFDRYLKLIGKAWAADDYMNLLSIRDIRRLLKSANIKNYQIIKNKFLFFTLDFIIIF